MEGEREIEIQVWQGGMMVASAHGKRAEAEWEAMHYAAVYAQDGPVELIEVIRSPIPVRKSTGGD